MKKFSIIFLIGTKKLQKNIMQFENEVLIGDTFELPVTIGGIPQRAKFGVIDRNHPHVEKDKFGHITLTVTDHLTPDQQAIETAKDDVVSCLKKSYDCHPA